MVVKKSCWETVPDLPLDPADIGEELTVDQLQKLAVSFVLLANYVKDQRELCGQ